MKLAIASDLHLEFGPIVLENTEGAEVLVLAGDICVAHDLFERDYEHSNQSKRIHDFFYDCCNKFPHVVYVLGNHEHYHGDYKYTAAYMKRMLKYLPNLQILDMETWTLHDEITFIGGTLWTDMNKSDFHSMHHVKNCMRDFQCIANSNRMVQRKVPLYELNPSYTPDGKNGGRYNYDETGSLIKIGEKVKEEPAKLSPEDTVEFHKKMVDYIKIVTEFLGDSPKKFVVVGHHTPSTFSIHPKYRGHTLMNGAYSSDLSELMLDRPCIKLWVHGHTHDPFDYTIGETRVVCNPRGYIGHEEQAKLFNLKYVEV